VVSSLATRLRAQAHASRDAATRTGALYDMVRELVATRDAEQALAAGVRHIEQVFAGTALVLLPDGSGGLRRWGEGEALDAREAGVADWVYANGRAAGAGTDTLPSASRLYLPLQASGGLVGVLGVKGLAPEDQRRLAEPERMHLLQAFTGQIAVALERARLAEEALRTRELVSMAELKSEFVEVASQKLTAPVQRLAAALAAAQPDGATGDHGKALAEAGREAAQLQALTRDLLDLSQLEGGRAQLRLKPTDLSELVREAAAAFEPVAHAHQVELVADLPDDLPPVRADRERIGAVLANLFSNAVRHSDAGGRIFVAADDVGGFVQLSVADMGAGVALEDQARIFDRFAQVGRGGEEGGTGLGLAVAREVLLAHGGAIWVDSGPGPGTVFSFTLPIQSEEP